MQIWDLFDKNSMYLNTKISFCIVFEDLILLCPAEVHFISSLGSGAVDILCFPDKKCPRGD